MQSENGRNNSQFSNHDTLEIKRLPSILKSPEANNKTKFETIESKNLNQTSQKKTSNQSLTI